MINAGKTNENENGNGNGNKNKKKNGNTFGDCFIRVYLSLSGFVRVYLNLVRDSEVNPDSRSKSVSFTGHTVRAYAGSLP